MFSKKEVSVDQAKKIGDSYNSYYWKDYSSATNDKAQKWIEEEYTFALAFAYAVNHLSENDKRENKDLVSTGSYAHLEFLSKRNQRTNGLTAENTPSEFQMEEAYDKACKLL